MSCAGWDRWGLGAFLPLFNTLCHWADWDPSFCSSKQISTPESRRWAVTDRSNLHLFSLFNGVIACVCFHLSMVCLETVWGENMSWHELNDGRGHCICWAPSQGKWAVPKIEKMWQVIIYLYWILNLGKTAKSAKYTILVGGKILFIVGFRAISFLVLPPVWLLVFSALAFVPVIFFVKHDMYAWKHSPYTCIIKSLSAPR